MPSAFSSINSMIALGLLFIVSGCNGGNDGPALGRVNGSVSLDGKPLEGATLIFNPVAGGRGSFGTTDSSGNYSLEYAHDQPGAILGKHQIRINSASFSGEGAEDPLLPAEYNSVSQLKATVDAGSNTLNFDLKSDGSIVSSN